MRSCERKNRIAADGPKHCALARHIGSAHDERLGVLVEPQVVGDGAIPRKEGMGEANAVEGGPMVDDFGEGVGGILEGEIRSRAERLDLPRRFDPNGQARSATSAPSFEGKRHVGAPHQEAGDRREELIRSGIAAIDQAPERLKLAGRRPSRGFEFRAEPRKERGFEGFVFDAAEECGRPGEGSDGRIRGGEDRGDARAQKEGE